MRPVVSLLKLAIVASSVVSAWPQWLPERDALMVRADDGGKASPASTPATSTPTGKPSSADPSAKPSESLSPNQTNLNTAKPKSSGASVTGTDSSEKPKGTDRTDFGPDAAAGAITMITPAINAAATPLYRISDYVTFGWNYTALQGTPGGIDVLISCTEGGAHSWTLTSNMTYQTVGSYVWDTKVQANNVDNPLLTAKYTLIIKDSDTALTAAPQPGYLRPFMDFTFGLYKAKHYDPLPEFTCPGCNSANSKLNNQAMGLAIGMSIVTVMSFTWFVSGIGLQ